MLKHVNSSLRTEYIRNLRVIVKWATVELWELKTKILKLLKEDEEFRYTVAGLIGLEEFLRKLDEQGAKIAELLEEIRELREDQKRLWEEVRKLRKDFNEMLREQRKLRASFESFGELWELH